MILYHMCHNFYWVYEQRERPAAFSPDFRHNGDWRQLNERFEPAPKTYIPKD